MPSHWELVARLVIAAVLGSFIGADRERLVWAAGLRTHMLVCVGACLFMIVSAFGFADILGGAHIVLDPSRVAAQVVSGIGFLGAGSILLRGEVVRGLTTAASLWTVAAIGLAMGGGLYVEATAATVVILLILAGLKPVEEQLQRRNQSHEIKLRAEHGHYSAARINELIGYRARRIVRYVCERADDQTSDDIVILTVGLSERDIDEIAQKFHDQPEIRDVLVSSVRS